MESKTVILYFDDETSICALAKLQLETAFDGYDIQCGHNVGDLDSILMQIGGVERIALVCTDGKLKFNGFGWEIIEKLMERGYNGPSIYTGNSTLPETKKDLYVGLAPKRGAELVRILETHLSKNLH
jgi:hypothetical protein